MQSDLRYLFASVAATAAFTFVALAFPNLSRLATIPAVVAFFGLTLYFLWPELKALAAFPGERLKRMWPQYLMTLSATGFFVGLVAFLQLNVPSPPTTAPEVPRAPERTPDNRTSESPTPQSTGIRKFIAEGLVKARDDLRQIKKAELSCEGLSAWQARADAATRLAHANGIGVHNPISQHIGACQNITDVELLDAIRTTIVDLLNRGIQATGV